MLIPEKFTLTNILKRARNYCNAKHLSELVWRTLWVDQIWLQSEKKTPKTRSEPHLARFFFIKCCQNCKNSHFSSDPDPEFVGSGDPDPDKFEFPNPDPEKMTRIRHTG